MLSLRLTVSCTLSPRSSIWDVCVNPFAGKSGRLCLYLDILIHSGKTDNSPKDPNRACHHLLITLTEFILIPGPHRTGEHWVLIGVCVGEDMAWILWSSFSRNPCCPAIGLCGLGLVSAKVSKDCEGAQRPQVLRHSWSTTLVMTAQLRASYLFLLLLTGFFRQTNPKPEKMKVSELLERAWQG
jgi:hypothetical protein